MEVDLHMWPAGAEILQRRRQPLNTAVTFDSQPQPGLLWFVTVRRARAICGSTGWPAVRGFPLRSKTQRLALTHKETKAKALFQIAELVRQGGLGLVQAAAAPASEPLFRNACSVFRCLISIMKVLHFAMSNLRLRNIQ